MSSNNSCSSDVPPFHGYVETTVHALRLIHAARQGIIPRITRRLNDTERRSMVKSGAVFIFSVEESGIKRWTDGLLWSPSRIVGNFLVYREINERASSRGSHKKYAGDDSRSPPVHRNSPGLATTGYKGTTTGYSSGSDQGTFKPNGLIKKTITVTIEGSDLHLISYYTSEDIRSGRLKKPSSRLDIMNLYMPPHIFRLTNFRVPPKVEMGPDGKPRLVSEPEDDPVECKVEEQTYSPTHSAHSSSPTSPVSTVDSYSGTTLYPLSPLTSGSSGYSRSNATERWNGSTSLDNLRMSASSRQETPWPVPPTSSHSSHVTLSSRRDTAHGESWSAHGIHSSGRWQNDSYETMTSPDLGNDRSSRTVRSGHPYQNTVREQEGMGYNSRYIGRSQRLPWVMNSDAPSSSSSGKAFHSYGSGWAPSGDAASLDVSSQASYSQQHYPSYTSGSGEDIYM